jgi:hypothetical protein
MTKMITAAAILRMTEEEKYQQFLPDGIDTKLSVLLPLLKKHYPDSAYINPKNPTDIITSLELQPDFKDITLQHLAQHTSGLARVKSDAFLDSGHKLTPDEMTDAEKKPKTGEFGERIGEYFYNNLGYELLGRVIVAIDSEQKDHASKFSDVVDELVISRVKEKVGEEEKKDQSEVNLRFFTSDQMEIVGGRTRVVGYPELKIEFGKDYHDGQFQEVPSHFYDLASGGGYADPESMSKIAFHILHSTPEFSVFKKPKTLEIFNGRQIPKRELDGSLNKQGKTYGFGYESYSDPAYEQYRTHGGQGYGSNSNSFVDTKNNKVAVAMVGFENLTLPLAYAIINKEKASTPIRLSPELYQKSQELSKSYSEKQLIEMRQELDKSYDAFRAKLKQELTILQKQRHNALDFAKPSGNPEQGVAKMMSGKTRGGFNEV